MDNYEVIRIHQGPNIIDIAFLDAKTFNLFDRMVFLQKNMSRSTSTRLFQNQLLRSIYEDLWSDHLIMHDFITFIISYDTVYFASSIRLFEYPYALIRWPDTFPILFIYYSYRLWTYFFNLLLTILYRKFNEFSDGSILKNTVNDFWTKSNCYLQK